MKLGLHSGLADALRDRDQTVARELTNQGANTRARQTALQLPRFDEVRAGKRLQRFKLRRQEPAFGERLTA